MSNKQYFLALNRIKQIGPRTIMKLLERWPDLQEVFQAPMAALENAGISTQIAKAIKTFDWAQLELDWQWQQRDPSHHLLTWCDPEYPRLLKEIYDPPPVLYAIGDLSCLKQPSVAIIGSRNPTPTGGETAKRFAFELAAKNITIVSGLALGIDGQAHWGSLNGKGKTVAVMGTGIDRIYPYRHKNLAACITRSGLLLSEFPLGTPPVAGHFPRRNRIISGLSLAILVVEAALRSGSLITARLALEQNRDVLAIPGSIYNQQSRGCHYLLQQGAKLVTSSEDVISELGFCKEPIREDEKEVILAIETENLVKCIGFEVTTVDQIIARSGLSIEKVSCNLAELELQGFVSAVPGGYMRCTT